MSRLAGEGYILNGSGELDEDISDLYIALGVIEEDLHEGNITLLVETLFESDMCFGRTLLDKTHLLNHMAGVQTYVGHVLSRFLRNQESPFASDGWQFDSSIGLILYECFDGVLDTELACRFPRIYEARRHPRWDFE